jgi:hypothetical protein
MKQIVRLNVAAVLVSTLVASVVTMLFLLTIGSR